MAHLRRLVAIFIVALGARASGQDAAPLIPVKDIDSVMKQFNVALGVECTHCHVQDQWKDSSKPAWTIARNMWQMVAVLNAGSLSNTKGVRCQTCHDGQVRPSRLPPAAWMAIRDKWPESLASAEDSVKLGMSVYNASLGVECAFCHDTAKWKDTSKPPHKMVNQMSAMWDVFPKYMPASARTQCFMCHKGQRSPK